MNAGVRLAAFAGVLGLALAGGAALGAAVGDGGGDDVRRDRPTTHDVHEPTEGR